MAGLDSMARGLLATIFNKSGDLDSPKHKIYAVELADSNYCEYTRN